MDKLYKGQNVTLISKPEVIMQVVSIDYKVINGQLTKWVICKWHNENGILKTEPFKAEDVVLVL